MQKSADQAIWDRLLIDCWVRNRPVIVLVKLFLLEARGLCFGRKKPVNIDYFVGIGLLRAPSNGDFAKPARAFIFDHCEQMSRCLFDHEPTKVLAAIDRFSWGDKIVRQRVSRAHRSKDEFRGHHGADMVIRWRERDKQSNWTTVK